MTSFRAGISVQLQPGRAAVFEEIAKRLKKPMAGGRGRVVAQKMRQGDGSIGAQFRAESEITGTGRRRRWKRTRPFGNRSAPRRTLYGRGTYEGAWLGLRSGSLTIVRDRSVAVGVSTARYPQARVFQRLRPTIVRPRRMGPRGRWAMAWFLGLTYDVWLSNARLQRGLINYPRRVSLNPAMLRRAGVALREMLITGNAQSARNI